MTVEKQSAGYTFVVMDPESYPYGGNTFEDEDDIKRAHWTGFSPGELAVDVGCAWGGYALLALAQGAGVLAFDTTEDAERVLMANVTANNTDWLDRYTFVRAALWDGKTDYPEWMRKEIFEVRYPTGGAVVLTALDAVVSDLGIPRVDRMKVDVEGAELGVLRGAEAVLRKHHPRLLIEDHAGIYETVTRGESTDPLLRFLSEVGYADVAEQWWGDRPGGRSFIIAK